MTLLDRAASFPTQFGTPEAPRQGRTQEHSSQGRDIGLKGYHKRVSIPFSLQQCNSSPGSPQGDCIHSPRLLSWGHSDHFRPFWVIWSSPEGPHTKTVPHFPLHSLEMPSEGQETLGPPGTPLGVAILGAGRQTIVQSQ